MKNRCNCFIVFKRSGLLEVALYHGEMLDDRGHKRYVITTMDGNYDLLFSEVINLGRIKRINVKLFLQIQKDIEVLGNDNALKKYINLIQLD